MKQKVANIILYCLVAILCLSCGDDQPLAPVNITPPTENVKAPVVDESSVSFDPSSQVLVFKALCPFGSIVRVRLRQLTNGTEEYLLDVSYNTNSQRYFVKFPKLVGGSTYAFCIVGYDVEGKEASRSAEQTFSLPKNAAPEAPATAGIKAYPPSAPEATDGYISGSVITKAMEYSITDGRTWMPVTLTGIVQNLPPGNVLLRLAETPTTEAGKVATIIVPPYRSNTDLDGTDGTSEGMNVRRPNPREG